MNNLFIGKKTHSRMSPAGMRPNSKRLVVDGEYCKSYTPKVKYMNLGSERRITAPLKQKCAGLSAPSHAECKSMEQQVSNGEQLVENSEKRSRKNIEMQPPKPFRDAVLVRMGLDGFSQKMDFNIDQNGQVSTIEPCQDTPSSKTGKLGMTHLRMSPKRSGEGVGRRSSLTAGHGDCDQSYTPNKVNYMNLGSDRRIMAPSKQSAGLSAPIDAKCKATPVSNGEQIVGYSEKKMRRNIQMRPPKPIKNAVLVRMGSDGFSQKLHFNIHNGQDSSVEPCQDSQSLEIQGEMTHSRMSPKHSGEGVGMRSNRKRLLVDQDCDQSYTPKVKYLNLGSERRITAPTHAKRKSKDQPVSNGEQVVGYSGKRSRRDLQMWPPKPIRDTVLVRRGPDGFSQKLHFNDQNRQGSSVEPCKDSRPSEIHKEMHLLQQTTGRLDPDFSSRCEVLRKNFARSERSMKNPPEIECFNVRPISSVGVAVRRANHTLSQTTYDSRGKNISAHEADYLEREIVAAETSEQNYNNHRKDISRDMVRNLLNLYKDTVERLQREEKMKPSGLIGMQINVKAAMQLKNQQKWLNVNKCIGPVPGIEIGDHFQSRAELVIVGLHSKFMAGIGSTKVNGKLCATSIIASGRYFGDRNDAADVLTYVGEGGNRQNNYTRPQDQELVRGNLALKNCIDGNPVRVIRSIEEPKLRDANTMKRSKYFYDGLYMVTKHWSEQDTCGSLVFKFELNKINGQRQLEFGRASRDYVAINDISKGKENVPIRVVNAYDDERPPPFNYVAKMVCSQQQCVISDTIFCGCNHGCSEDNPCTCLVKNNREVLRNNGTAQKPIVYECGPNCRCPPTCKYRLSQHGIQLQLEIFRTESAGWGVRSRNFISAGKFICEYIGELLRNDHENGRLDFGKSMDDTRNSFDTTYNDAYNERFGNVGRFIRYNCSSPNLYAKCVLFDHEDKSRPHIMLFAAKNIPPGRELTFDYKLWGQEGNEI